jgi:hypothetical protein
MHVARFVLAFLLLFSLPTLLNSQQTSSSPPRDPQALAAVQKAVTALGGTALSQIHDASVQGNIQILPASANNTLSVVWEDAWGNGAPSFRRESHIAGSRAVLLSANGQPVDTQAGIATKVPSYVTFSCSPVHLPGMVLTAQLNNSGYSLKFLGTTAVNSVLAVHIQSALVADPVTSAVSLQDWYFDPNSGLPLRVDYRVVNSGDPLNPGIASMQFANFRSVSGILVPFLLTETGLAGEQDIVTVTSVALNSGLSPSEFLPPAGAAQ